MKTFGEICLKKLIFYLVVFLALTTVMIIYMMSSTNESSSFLGWGSPDGAIVFGLFLYSLLIGFVVLIIYILSCLISYIKLYRKEIKEGESQRQIIEELINRPAIVFLLMIFSLIALIFSKIVFYLLLIVIFFLSILKFQKVNFKRNIGGDIIYIFGIFYVLIITIFIILN